MVTFFDTNVTFLYKDRILLKELFARIEKLDKVTSSESKLIRYFQTNEQRLALHTIYDISKGAKVSTATVTRFVTKIGYADFVDFKNSITRELMTSLDSSFERYQLSKHHLLDGAQSVWARFCELVISDIRAAHSNIPDARLKKVARLIAQTKGNIYVMGQFNSYVVAHLLYQQLLLLRPGIIFLENQAGNLPYQFMDAGENDLIFAVTYQRYADQVTKTVKQFSRKKAKVVVLNDSASSPVSGYADIELTVPIAWSAVFGSRCSGLVVVEALTVILAQMLEKNLGDRMTKAMLLSGEYNSFTHKIKQKRILQKGLESKP